MERIIIRNFGPIDFVELDVRPFLVFIGPQATGKSTISKSIYFFKSLRNDVLKYFIDVIETGNFEKSLGKVGKRIRAKFLNFFGPTAHIDDLYLHYEYGNHKSLTINLKGKYVNPIFNEEFKRGFKAILNQIEESLSDSFHRDLQFLSSSELIKIAQEKKRVLNKIESLVNDLFEDDKDLLFIPAGRSLLTTLSDQLHYIHPHKMDYLMQAFIDRINATKPLFTKSLQELIEDKKFLTNEAIKFGFVKSAKKIIENILRAKYINDYEGEKLFVSSKKYVKINYSSSGQQESIWILNLIFISLLNNNKVFVVIEEPEAHLYPEAQQQIIDLIALLFNSSNSQIIITTHSPYILSAINNLIYADVLFKKGKDVKSIVEKRRLIDGNSIDGYLVQNGKLNRIIDDETKMIRSEAIDSASRKLNDIFNKLFELDDYEL